jgi:hypothetical protein
MLIAGWWGNGKGRAVSTAFFIDVTEFLSPCFRGETEMEFP